MILYQKNTNGCVTNYRGINLIIINDKLSHYYKRKTILHELAHIKLNQLNQLDVELLAFKVNKYKDEANLYINFLLKSVKESEENGVIIY